VSKQNTKGSYSLAVDTIDPLPRPLTAWQSPRDPICACSAKGNPPLVSHVRVDPPKVGHLIVAFGKDNSRLERALELYEVPRRIVSSGVPYELASTVELDEANKHAFAVLRCADGLLRVDGAVAPARDFRANRTALAFYRLAQNSGAHSPDAASRGLVQARWTPVTANFWQASVGRNNRGTAARRAASLRTAAQLQQTASPALDCTDRLKRRTDFKKREGQLLIATINPNGLDEAKSAAVLNAASHRQLDVVVLSESHSPAPEARKRIRASGFELAAEALRADPRNGGVHIMVRRRERMTVEVLPALPPDPPEEAQHMEACAVRIFFPGGAATVVGVYISPHSAPASTELFLRRIATFWDPDVITGDFNAAHCTWDARAPSRQIAWLRGDKVHNFATQRDFVVINSRGQPQITHPPAHDGPAAGEGSAIDLVLVRESLARSPWWVVPASALFDHHMVGVDLTLYAGPVKPKPLRWSVRWDYVTEAHRAEFRRLTLERLAAAFPPPRCAALPETAASSADPALCIGKTLEELQRLILVAADDAFPQLRATGADAHFEIPAAVRMAEHAFAALPADTPQATRTALRAALHKLSREESDRARQSNVDIQLGAPGGAWRVAQSLDPPSPLQSTVGSWKTDAEQAAGFQRLFVEKHAARGSAAGALPTPPPRVRAPQRGFDVTAVAASEVRWAVFQAKASRCVDAGGLSIPILRECPEPVFEALALLFTMSLRFTGFPPSWSQGIFVPALKNGKPPELPPSYRPLCITRTLCRVMERVVLKRIAAKIAPTLGAHQYGFRKGRRCEMILVDLMCSIAEANDTMFNAGGTRALSHQRGGKTVVIAFDLSDAFCTVPLPLIAEGLAKANLDTAYVEWIHAFLTNRSASTRVRSARSEWTPLESGTPQGGVLSPLLWCLAVGGLEELLTLWDTAYVSSVRSEGRAGSSRWPRKQLCRMGWGFYADDLTIWISGYVHGGLHTAFYRAVNDVAMRTASWFLARGIGVSPKTSAILTGAPPDGGFPNDAAAAAGGPRSPPGAGACLGQVAVWGRQDPDAVIPGQTAVVATSQGTRSWSLAVKRAPIRALGMWVDAVLGFGPHMRALLAALLRFEARIKELTRWLPVYALKMILEAWMASRILWGAEVWFAYAASGPRSLRASVLACYTRTAAYISGAFSSAKRNAVLLETGLLPLEDVVACRRVVLTEVLIRQLALPATQTLRRTLPLTARHATSGWLRSSFAAHASAHLHLNDVDRIPRLPIVDDSRPFLAGGYVAWDSKIKFDCPRPGTRGAVYPRGADDATIAAAKQSYNAAAMARHAGKHCVQVFADGAAGCPPSGGHAARECLPWTATGAALAFADDAAAEPCDKLSLFAGSKGCSYTAEAAGIRCGLTLLDRFAQRPELAQLPRRSALIGLDTLSWIHALMCSGPLSQRHATGVLISDELTRLTAGVYDEITLMFCYAHVGLPRNEQVDAYASEAQADSAAAAGFREEPPEWLVDSTCGAERAIRAAASITLQNDSGFRGRLGGNNNGMRTAKELAAMAKLLKPFEHRILIQLRTGKCSRLGGWNHATPQACYHCHAAAVMTPQVCSDDGTITVRGAVYHFLCCDALAVREMRVATFGTADHIAPAMLLDDRKAKQLVDYLVLFAAARLQRDGTAPALAPPEDDRPVADAVDVADDV
jgi:hypothetical protein